MENTAMVKADRVLRIYLKLSRGETLRKEDLAKEFQVTVRTIQRDISSLRGLMEDYHTGQDIINDHGYRIQQRYSTAAGVQNHAE